MEEKVFNSYEKLKKWYQLNGDKSYDVSDVGATRLFIKLSHIKKNSKVGNLLTYPFFYLKNHYITFFRKTLKLHKLEFPQAYAKILRSYLIIYQISGDKRDLDKIKLLIQKLKDSRSTNYQEYCWGQPYDWYSRKYIPAGTPRTTVTAQVIHSYLDAYEIFGNKEYLDIAGSSCQFFIKHLNYKADEDGHFCFSYTPLDDYNIHNAGVLAASALIRTGKILNNEEFIKYGIKNIDFTVKHQNPDGSWYYWAKPFKIIHKIDNYHTGFVLDSLYTVNTILDNYPYENSLKKGLEFYIDNFFEESGLPKMTPKSIYPIDIQSCAQSLITTSLLLKKYPCNEKLLTIRNKVLNWTIDNMQKEDGSFNYRIYKSGKVDKNSYIRWGESWMLHALSLVIESSRRLK